MLRSCRKLEGNTGKKITTGEKISSSFRRHSHSGPDTLSRWRALSSQLRWYLDCLQILLKCRSADNDMIQPIQVTFRKSPSSIATHVGGRVAERVFHPSLHQVNLNQAVNWAQVVFGRARECLCAMRGHDLLLHFAPRRLSLRCTKCGWDSPAWSIEKSNRGTFRPMPMMDLERDKLKTRRTALAIDLFRAKAIATPMSSGSDAAAAVGPRGCLGDSPVRACARSTMTAPGPRWPVGLRLERPSRRSGRAE
jgi:hypothetical protein